MKDLKQLGNTPISYKQMKSKQHLIQSHYKRISDYIKMGDTYWKNTEDGIEFLDSNTEEENHDGPPLLHFRSHSMSFVHDHLEKIWQECIQAIRQQSLIIPLHQVKIYNSSGKFIERINTGFQGNHV